MSSQKLSISQPQSQAGILGVASNTNMGGWKFTPQIVVAFAIVFVIVVKILDFMVANGTLGRA